MDVMARAIDNEGHRSFVNAVVKGYTGCMNATSGVLGPFLRVQAWSNDPCPGLKTGHVYKKIDDGGNGPLQCDRRCNEDLS